MLSNAAKALLLELKIKVEWEEILKELKVPSPPRYKPSGLGEAKDPKDWIFWSGRSLENERIINLLEGNEK